MNFTTYGGRRFLMVMGCSIVCTVLVYLGKIDGNIFRDIIIGTVGTFIVGNSWQKVGTAKAQAAAAPDQEAVG
jgi:hypothetical protein